MISPCPDRRRRLRLFQYWDQIRVHPSVQWAKREALVEGAALASQKLWGR